MQHLSVISRRFCVTTWNRELKDVPFLSSPAASEMKVKASVRIILCWVWLDLDMHVFSNFNRSLMTYCVRMCISVNIDFTVFKLVNALIPALYECVGSKICGRRVFIPVHTAGLITLQWTIRVRFSQQNTQKCWTAETLQDKDDSRYQRIIIGYTASFATQFTQLICQVLCDCKGKK